MPKGPSCIWTQRRKEVLEIDVRICWAPEVERSGAKPSGERHINPRETPQGQYKDKTGIPMKTSNVM